VLRGGPHLLGCEVVRSLRGSLLASFPGAVDTTAQRALGGSDLPPPGAALPPIDPEAAGKPMSASAGSEVTPEQQLEPELDVLSTEPKPDTPSGPLRSPLMVARDGPYKQLKPRQPEDVDCDVKAAPEESLVEAVDPAAVISDAAILPVSASVVTVNDDDGGTSSRTGKRAKTASTQAAQIVEMGKVHPQTLVGRDPSEPIQHGLNDPSQSQPDRPLEADLAVLRIDPAAKATSPASQDITSWSLSPATPPAGGQTTPAAVDSRGEIRLCSHIEAAIEQFAEAREAARSTRPEVTMRHAEFGLVSMRLDASGSELRATLAARDPGFVPAVQAALAERAVTGAEAGAQAQMSLSQRSQDQSGSNADNGRSGQGQSNSGQGHGDSRDGSREEPRSDQHYGISTGSDQVSPSPYEDQDASDGPGQAIEPRGPVEEESWESRDRFA